MRGVRFSTCPTVHRGLPRSEVEVEPGPQGAVADARLVGRVGTAYMRNARISRYY